MQDRKTRILMPTIVDPAHHRGGCGTVMRGLLKSLAREPLGAQVDTLPAPSDSPAPQRGRQLMSLAKSAFSRHPAKAIFTHSPEYERSLRERLESGDYDLVVINGSDLLWTLPLIPEELPRVLIAHNLEHRLYRFQIDGLKFAPFRPFLLRDCDKLKTYEVEGWEKVGDVIFLSDYEDEEALAISPELNTIVIPPLFDYPRAPRTAIKSESDPLNVGLPANFTWWPNRQGVEWFLRDVFSAIGSHVTFHLFGEGSDTVAPTNTRVVRHGYVERVQDIWPQIDIMICPIFSGAGVKVKLAEALYNRVPVLASSFAARGLPVGAGPGLMLLDTAREWIEFLNSAEARLLARGTVPPLLSGAFEMDRHTGPLQGYLFDVMRGTKAERNACEANSQISA